MNIALCFCVRNCEKFFKYIFLNIERLKNENINIYCIFVYDNCTDNSEQILKWYQMNNKNVIVKHIQNTSKYRTVRIASARNECLRIVYNELPNIKYHIAIDCDDVNSIPWNISLIHNYLNNFDNDDWDCISFNRPSYYDIWALLFDNYRHHYLGFKNNIWDVHNMMYNDITKKLFYTKSNSIEVISAFNGFAIYKTDKFKQCYYDGLYSNVKKIITPQERINTLRYIKYRSNLNVDINHKSIECCEHIFYHLLGIHNGCKIKISKYNLFIPYKQLPTPPKLNKNVIKNNAKNIISISNKK